jgi:hypothetical protein
MLHLDLRMLSEILTAEKQRKNARINLHSTSSSRRQQLQLIVVRIMSTGSIDVAKVHDLAAEERGSARLTAYVWQHHRVTMETTLPLVILNKPTCGGSRQT